MFQFFSLFIDLATISRLPSSILYFLPLAWLWFRLIGQLRIGWSMNPQYAYGWAVPFLCLYLYLAESREQKARKRVSQMP